MNHDAPDKTHRDWEKVLEYILLRIPSNLACNPQELPDQQAGYWVSHYQE